MARITAYTAVGSSQGRTALEDTDVFLLDGTGGTRKINAVELANAVIDKSFKNAASVGAGYGKSGVYRGANLGSGATFEAASTADQRAAIAAGTFEGLFVGDYWTVNGAVYRIADFNYWKRSGDNDFNVNHVVLVPDASFGSGKMNSTNTIVGAYAGSEMYTDASSVLNTARNTIATDFGGYLATHREYLPNTVSNGAQSAGAWFDSTVELMSEIMVCGTYLRCVPLNGSYIATINKSQLALFRLNPAMINPSRIAYWLREVGSYDSFVYITQRGNVDVYRAGYSAAVRPVFAIKGTS